MNDMEKVFAEDLAAVIAEQPAILRGAFGEIQVTSGVPNISGAVSDAGFVPGASVVVVGVTADLKGKELREREPVELKLSGSSTPFKCSVQNFQYDLVSFSAVLVRTQGNPSGVNFT